MLNKTPESSRFRVAYLSRFSVAYEVVNADGPEGAAQAVREICTETIETGYETHPLIPFVPIILAVEACEADGFAPRKATP